LIFREIGMVERLRRLDRFVFGEVFAAFRTHGDTGSPRFLGRKGIGADIFDPIGVVT